MYPACHIAFASVVGLSFSMENAFLNIHLMFFRWSVEFGACRNGSPELHVMLAEYIYSESPEVVGLMTKNVGFKKYLVVAASL